MCETEYILRSMKTASWERAKGELLGLLNTYAWNLRLKYTQKVITYDEENENFLEFKKVIDDFIKNVEDNGYQE